MFSAFNPSKCTNLEQWAANCAAPGRGLPVGAGIRTPQPWVTSGFKSNALSIRPTTALKLSRLWSHAVMSGLATYISDYSNIGCVEILTFIYMLNVLHITSSFMLKCHARYWLTFIWDGHIAFRCFFFKYPQILFVRHICSTVCILQLKLFSYFAWLQKHAGDFRNHLIMLMKI